MGNGEFVRRTSGPYAVTHHVYFSPLGLGLSIQQE